METLQRLHNRGSISTGYDIDNSLKMEADNSEYLSRVLSTTSNRRTFTISTWRKRTELGDMQTMYSCNVSGQEGTLLRFATENASYPDAIQIDIGAVGTNSRSYTAASFRDTSAWYHVVLAVDTTQSTATDRFKLYVNGVLITDYASRNNPAQNFDTSNNHADNSNTQHVGAYTTGGQVYGKTSGYTADTYHIDGQALAPTEFGEFDEDTGIWKPKAYTGSYGTNGFFLDFSDSANLGDDVSGNSNNFTENNITSADQATDTPTNNFATINTLQGNSTKLIISNGATKIVKSGNYGWQTTTATMAVREGKWYAEFKLDTSCTTVMLGVNQIENEVAWSGSHIGVYSNSTARGMGYYSQNGYFYRNGGSGAIANTYTAGDIIGIALRINADGTGFMGMSKNGSWQNSQDPSSGITGMLGLEYGNPITDGISYTFAISTHESAGGVLANFGGHPSFTISSGNTDANGYGNFEYAVPSGYYALCTKNLAEYG